MIDMLSFVPMFTEFQPRRFPVFSGTISRLLAMAASHDNNG